MPTELSDAYRWNVRDYYLRVAPHITDVYQTAGEIALAAKTRCNRTSCVLIWAVQQGLIEFSFRKISTRQGDRRLNVYKTKKLGDQW